jgi:AcrR family transcriptional regulator
VNISRPYSSAVRDEAARATERRIVDAAERLFVARGYGPTTMAMIATEAGVSKQTVYNACRSKAQLLKRLYDVRLAGDQEPVPLAQRKALQDITARTEPRHLLAGYGELAGSILARLGPVIAVAIQGAAAGDRDLQSLLETTDGERLIGATNWANRLDELGALRAGIGAEAARDIIWSINSPQMWSLLVRRRGWDNDRYAAWLGSTLADVLLEPVD